jgi:hypothetical protein
MEARKTLPSRPLTDPRRRYVPAAHTDIRKTFAKFARLARIQAIRQKEAA